MKLPSEEGCPGCSNRSGRLFRKPACRSEESRHTYQEGLRDQLEPAKVPVCDRLWSLNDEDTLLKNLMSTTRITSRLMNSGVHLVCSPRAREGGFRDCVAMSRFLGFTNMIIMKSSSQL